MWIKNEMLLTHGSAAYNQIRLIIMKLLFSETKLLAAHGRNSTHMIYKEHKEQCVNPGDNASQAKQPGSLL